MLKVACFCLAMALTTPVWCQVEPAAVGGGFELDDIHMMTPPPVSRDVSPVVVGVEKRTNFLDAGLVFTGSYTDNLMFGGNAGKVSDEVYYFLPSVDLDRRSSRSGETLHYSAGFTLYDHVDQLNGATQDAAGQYRFHLSPYAVIEVNDRFQQNYNLYNQSNPFVSGGAVGGTGPSNNILVAPFANQISNSAGVGISDQYGRNAMIGASGAYTFYKFSDSAKNAGLNDEYMTSGVAFYSRRIAPSEYIGITDQFAKYITHPTNSYTATNTILGFYTHYFTKNFSASVLGGPEHYTAWGSGTAKRQSWTPAVQGSFGWESGRTSLSATFSHIVAGAPGLIGTFQANVAGLNGRMIFARTWSAGADAEYMQEKNVNPLLYPGGHTISGGIDLQHRMGERTSVAIGYGHFHESYGQLGTVTAFSPDSNRVYLSLNVGFHRPLGR